MAKRVFCIYINHLVWYQQACMYCGWYSLFSRSFLDFLDTCVTYLGWEITYILKLTNISIAVRDHCYYSEGLHPDDTRQCTKTGIWCPEMLKVCTALSRKSNRTQWDHGTHCSLVGWRKKKALSLLLKTRHALQYKHTSHHITYPQIWLKSLQHKFRLTFKWLSHCLSCILTAKKGQKFEFSLEHQCGSKKHQYKWGFL